MTSPVDSFFSIVWEGAANFTCHNREVGSVGVLFPFLSHSLGLLPLSFLASIPSALVYSLPVAGNAFLKSAVVIGSALPQVLPLTGPLHFGICLSSLSWITRLLQPAVLILLHPIMLSDVP